MRCHILPLGVLAAIASAPAQNTIVPTITAQSNLTVFAGNTSHTIPAGTNISTGTFQQTGLFAPLPVGAVSSMNVQNWARRAVRIQLGENVNVEQPNTTAGTGPNDVLIVLTPQQAVAAEIALSWNAHATLLPQFATASVSVDVGNDGSIELAGSIGNPGSYSQWRSIPAQGLPIRIVSQTQVALPNISGRSQVITNLQFSVTPASPCIVTGSGGGHCVALSPFQSGALTFDHTLLLETNWTPNQPVLTVFGTSLATIPLPGTHCNVDLQPIAWLATTTDPTGTSRIELPVPLGIPLTGHAQAVVLSQIGPLTFLTSEVITLICP